MTTITMQKPRGGCGNCGNDRPVWGTGGWLCSTCRHDLYGDE